MSLVGFVLASNAEARATVARISVVVDSARTQGLGTTEEIGVLEDRRLTHTWSKAESLAWLKALRPGVDVVWTVPDTRRVELTVRVPGFRDTLRVAVLGIDGVVRSEAPFVPNRHEQCLYKWNMEDDSGKRVEPGLYSIYLRRNNYAKILYVVVP